MAEKKKNTTENKTKTDTAKKVSNKTSANSSKKSSTKTKSSKAPAKRTKRPTKEELERMAREAAEQKKLRTEIIDEVILIVSIAFAALLILSNFGLTGAFGAMVNNAMFGLFGFMGYLTPVILVGFVLFALANRTHKGFWLRVLCAWIIFFLFTAMIQLAVGDTTVQTDLMAYYNNGVDTKNGGGLVGGFICGLLIPWLNLIGSFIVLATLEIICLFVITGKAFLKMFREYLKDRHERKVEEREEITRLYDEFLDSEEAGELLENDRKIIDYDLSKKDEALVKMPAKRGFFRELFEGRKVSEVLDEQEANEAKTRIPDILLPVDDEELQKPVRNDRLDEEINTGRIRDNSNIKYKDNRKRNFFGGYTDTKVFRKSEEQPVEVTEEVYTEPVKDAATESPGQDDDSLYRDEFDRKFKGKSSVRSVSSNVSETYSDTRSKLAIITDSNDDEYEDEPEADSVSSTIASPTSVGVSESVHKIEFEEIKPAPKSKYDDIFEPKKPEMSFSETALRDKNLPKYDEKELAKTFDEVPFSLRQNKPIAQIAPVTVQTSQEPEDAEDEAPVRELKELIPADPDNETTVEAVERVITNKVIEEENNQLAFVEETVKREYKFPPVELLIEPEYKQDNDYENELMETAEKLQETLDSFGVRVTVTDAQRGPSVTRYELQPETGVKVSRITGLADDIKLNLAAQDIRIEAPIPGKAAVGIEVPNSENTMVTLRELIECEEFQNSKGKIPFTVGKSIEGGNVIGDIAKMPHLMIAGSTGSGKSVCINTIIMSILYKAKPDDIKLIMIDPKVVELSVYNGIPHLLIPVVTDPKKAAAALNWACVEMDKRYELFAQLSVRDLKGYNERVQAEAEKGIVDENYPYMPQIVVIVDELADLMMVASNEVEDSICRLAQKARACGIHLIIATQRPSVNVITGLIKANIPSRIAFAVSSGVDSRTILDMVGAEKLLGKGDMLYYPSGLSKPVRIQGGFVSDKEVNAVVNYLKKVNDPVTYSDDINARLSGSGNGSGNSKGVGGPEEADDGRDQYFVEAGRFIIEKDKASIGMLQRAYKIGFNRAARIMDQLAEAGVVSEEDGNKPRQILMNLEQYDRFINTL